MQTLAKWPRKPQTRLINLPRAIFKRANKADFSAGLKPNKSNRIAEYKESDIFAVYDHEDILQMIQTLTRGLKTNLKSWWED